LGADADLSAQRIRPEHSCGAWSQAIRIRDHNVTLFVITKSVRVITYITFDVIFCEIMAVFANMRGWTRDISIKIGMQPYKSKPRCVAKPSRRSHPWPM
jgi:hypothetical protein